MMGRGWKDFTGFSRSERRGVMVLMALCMCSALFERTVPYYVSRREIRKFESQYAGLLAELRKEGPDAAPPLPGNYSLNAGSVAPFRAVPLGPEPTPDSVHGTGHVAVAAPGKPLRAVLEVNAADAPALIGTSLISPELAYRLVRYRDRLGGFHEADQLREVYGFTDSLFEGLRDLVELGDADLVKINVNRLSAEILQQHPYIHTGLARQMVNYREKVAPYHSREDLSRLYFMSDSLLERLMPYVEF